MLALSYVKNIGIRRAISSHNPEELDIIWQPQKINHSRLDLNPGLQHTKQMTYLCAFLPDLLLIFATSLHLKMEPSLLYLWKHLITMENKYEGNLGPSKVNNWNNDFYLQSTVATLTSKANIQSGVQKPVYKVYFL